MAEQKKKIKHLEAFKDEEVKRAYEMIRRKDEQLEKCHKVNLELEREMEDMEKALKKEKENNKDLMKREEKIRKDLQEKCQNLETNNAARLKIAKQDKERLNGELMIKFNLFVCSTCIPKSKL